VETSERLVKVTMASTIMFATLTAPNVLVIYLDIQKYDPSIFQIMEYSGGQLSQNQLKETKQ
jgi:hypothetical protein